MRLSEYKSKYKHCNKCHTTKPATTEYFWYCCSTPDKLNTACKMCLNKIQRKQYKKYVKGFVLFSKEYYDNLNKNK